VRKIIPVLVLAVITGLSCNAFREIRQKDDLGRTEKIAYYNGSTLNHIEEKYYAGNSFNPSRIVYKKLINSRLVPYKEESYKYKNYNLTSQTFFIYNNKRKVTTGMIRYSYQDSKINRIEYYTLIPETGSLVLFGLNQYSYNDGILSRQRIIKYALNRVTSKPMQTGQYVVNYSGDSPVSMTSWVIDMESKKIVENNLDEPAKVRKRLKEISFSFINKSKGRKFLIY